MVSIDDLKDMKIYRKQFFLPINMKNKLKGSAIFLMTPSYEASLEAMSKPFTVNKNYFVSYYLEKDINRFIQNESLIEIKDDSLDYIIESEDGSFKMPLNEFTKNNALYQMAKKVSNIIIYEGKPKEISSFKDFCYGEDITLRDCFDRMHKTYPEEVTIRITSNPQDDEEFTDSSLVVYTSSAWKKLYPKLAYHKYVKFVFQLFAIYTLKPLHRQLIKYATRPIDSIAIPAAIVLSGIHATDIKAEKKIDVRLEKVFMYIIDTYGMDYFIELIASNDLETLTKLNREYIDTKMAKTRGELYTECSQLKEAFEEAASVSTPKKVDPTPDSMKILKNANLRLKRKMRKPIYKLNALVRDMESKQTVSKPNISMPAGASSSSSSSSSSEDSSSSEGEESSGEEEVKTEQLDMLTGKDYISDGNYVYLFEDSQNYNALLKKVLYKERIKNDKAVLQMYKKVQTDAPYIQYTYIKVDRYKNRNLFIDLYYYHDSFFRNMKHLNDNGKMNTVKVFNTYLQLIERLMKDDKFSSYNKKTVFIPILEWHHNGSKRMWRYQEDINPISAIYYMMKSRPDLLKKVFGNKDILFYGDSHYFKLNLSRTPITEQNTKKFVLLVTKILKGDFTEEEADTVSSSPKGIAMDLVSKVEKSQNVTITNVAPIAKLKNEEPDLEIDEEEPEENEEEEEEDFEEEEQEEEPEEESDEEEEDEEGGEEITASEDEADNETTEEAKKDEIVKKIAKASKNSEDTGEAMKKLNKDDEFKEMVIALQNDSVENVRVTKAQASKVINAQNEFHKKQVAGRSVEDLLSENKASETLPATELKVASINKDWKQMTFMNFDKDYDLDADILKMLDSMQYWTYPIAVRDIEVKDNSTSEDFVDLWKIDCIDFKGTRFTIKVDVPKFINGSNFLKLRGNEKLLMIQSALLPIVKSDQDECQIIGSGGYNKIFIRKFGGRTGQSLPSTSRLLKALDRFRNANKKGIKVIQGNNTHICEKYNLPMDYLDIAGVVNSIETTNLKFFFNQDELRKDYKVDDNKGVPLGIRKNFSQKDKKVVDNIIYFDGKNFPNTCQLMGELLCEEIPPFREIYDEIHTSGGRFTYSKASILNKKIPVVLICGYLEGLVPTMNKAGVKYQFVPKLTKDIRYSSQYDYIKFKDGYLVYEITYGSSLLMNGLKEHDTESYSLRDINNRMMYIDLFNTYGSFIEHGLENSYDCMIDPITKEILTKCNLPTDYVSVMTYASNLLADNKYVKHIDQSGRRWRRKELIAGYFYKALTNSYQTYSNSVRNSRKGSKMEMKQSAIIDLITSKDPATTDLSINHPLNDIESANTVTNKGLVGMNVARGYTINTRGYDDSMLNLLGMDTGFTGTVGINRQATMNANIEGKRGFVKTIGGDSSKLSVAASLTATEAVTPFGITHDDPQRTLMTFVQTSKHMVRCEHNDPTLITTGADEAIPYMVSDIFAHKAKQEGKVVELVQNGFGKENYMVVQYKDKTNEVINLSELVKKNSDGGYFVPLKLDTDLKVGKTFKAGEVIAYDSKSFASSLGESGNLAMTTGTLAKIAIINTDEGYEDSAAVTERFAEKMGTDVIQEVETKISKGSNIFIEKNIGDHVIEGDTLFAYQTDFDDEAVNSLLKNLATDKEQVSELGKTPVKTKYTGIVSDILIYRTCELDEMSPSLKKFVSAYENKINKLKQTYKKYKNDTVTLPPSGKVPEIGKTKHVDDAVLIIYFIKHTDHLSVGDKIVFYSANKGVIKYLIPKGEEPYTEFRPKEKIDSFMSLSSISGRMTFSTAVFTAVSKLMVELDRSVKDIAGIPYDDSEI